MKHPEPEHLHPEHEIIWNNQTILVDKKSLIYNSWFYHPGPIKCKPRVSVCRQLPAKI